MNDNTILQLNIFLQKTYGTLKYYQRIAKRHNDLVEVHEFFNRKANERYVFGNQLKEEIVRLDGRIYEHEELEHLKIQPWYNYQKQKIKKSEIVELMQECEKAELRCLKDYDNVLQYDSLPDSTRKLLKEQYDVISGFRWNVQLNILLSQIENNSFLDE